LFFAVVLISQEILKLFFKYQSLTVDGFFVCVAVVVVVSIDPNNYFL